MRGRLVAPKMLALLMTSFYWSSLVEKAGVKPPPALPTCIGDLRDEQCPASE